MKKLLFLFLASFAAFAVKAQTSCNAAMTWVQNPNSYSVTFTRVGTVSPAVPPTNAFTNEYISYWNGSNTNWIYYTGNTATYNFNAPGTYNVIAHLQWTDSLSVPPYSYHCYDTTHYTITVTPQPCAVNITSITGTGLSRTLSVNGGVASPGTTYTWNFGGTVPTATGATVNYTFPAPGSYPVVVTATNGTCTMSAQSSVLITAPPNCANSNASFTAGTPNSSGTVFFTNTSTPNGNSIPGFIRQNAWNFGIPNSNIITYGQSGASHTYAATGTYTVRLVTTWVDSSTQNVSCHDTAYQTVTIATGAPFNCATANASFTSSGSNGYANFLVNTTPSSSPVGITTQKVWNFGDGSPLTTTTANSVTHWYAVNGSYNVTLIHRWLQNGVVICADTATSVFNATLPNIISGYVSADSTPNQPHDTFKVWLITYNAQTSMLAAVDSTVISGWGNAHFQFHNKPAGIYRTKAHKLNQPPSTNGYVPTYRDSSLTWSGAQTFTHNNGVTHSGGIYLKHGLVTSGPGFVGGSVLMGANKGTADGDPVANQLIFLRDANGGLVQSAYTNSAGQYSFTNVPVGTYTVYPEEMNYTTTPSSSITITAGNSSVNGVSFKKDEVDMSFAPSTTGIDSRNARSINFIMVPNPTSGDVVLNFGADAKGKADVQITSLAGQVVYREVFNATKAASLSLSRLGSGMYFVTVSSDAGSHTEKLIIAK